MGAVYLFVSLFLSERSSPVKMEPTLVPKVCSCTSLYAGPVSSRLCDVTYTPEGSLKQRSINANLYGSTRYRTGSKLLGFKCRVITSWINFPK